MVHTGAIIGFGGMGGWHYKNLTEKVPEMKIKGIYDIRPEAQQKATEAGLIAFASIEELLADESIEFVTIATPNDMHKPYAIAALRAGKHVICEKPVMLNAKELEEVIAVVEETGKIFTIHHNRRWDKDFCIVKKVLSENTIGTPYFIESRVQGSRKAMHGWRGHKVNGGGMLLDWGVHLLDQMMIMMDSPVVSVGAHLLNLYSDQVDDNIKVFLRFENGVSSVLEMSTNCLINLPRWHVSCLGGTMQIDNFKCEGKIMQLEETEAPEWEDEIVYTEAGPTRTMAPRPNYMMKETALPEVDTDWSNYYKNVQGVIEGTQDLIVTPQQALRVMKVVDMAFEANEKNMTIACHI